MSSSTLRQAFTLAAVTGIMLATSFVAVAQVPSRIEVWKSPYCGCCTKWVDKMKAAGFDVRIHNTENLSAIKRLHSAGIPKRNIKVYVLIGFQDSPDDALYRLRLIRNLGIIPFPMRFQPLDSLMMNIHVSSEWTAKELDRYMSYWANLRYTEGVPFEEYEHHGMRN